MLLYRIEISMFPLFFFFLIWRRADCRKCQHYVSMELKESKYVICLPTEDISFISDFLQFALSV